MTEPFHLHPNFDITTLANDICLMKVDGGFDLTAANVDWVELSNADTPGTNTLNLYIRFSTVLRIAYSYINGEQYHECITKIKPENTFSGP
jgi:hypothetical protein